MPAVTIRNLNDETHIALKQLAARHGRSTEAEIRSILDDAVRPEPEIGLGDVLAALGREIGGVDLLTERDQTPAGSTVSFE